MNGYILRNIKCECVGCYVALQSEVPVRADRARVWILTRDAKNAYVFKDRDDAHRDRVVEQLGDRYIWVSAPCDPGIGEMAMLEFRAREEAYLAAKVMRHTFLRDDGLFTRLIIEAMVRHLLDKAR